MSITLHEDQIVTYFSSFKLWFTLRVPDSAMAPSSPIALLPTLCRIRQAHNSTFRKEFAVTIHTLSISETLMAH